MSNLLKIVRLLPALTDGELSELANRIKSLRSVGHALVNSDGQALVRDTVRSDEHMVLAVIVQQLTRLGLEYPNMALLVHAARQRLEDGHSFREKVPGLMKFLVKAHRELTGQRAILALGVELLYRDLADRDLTVSHRTMMAHIHRIPAVLNRHFPGYASAGLLGWVVDKPSAAPTAQ